MVKILGEITMTFHGCSWPSWLVRHGHSLTWHHARDFDHDVSQVIGLELTITTAEEWARALAAAQPRTLACSLRCELELHQMPYTSKLEQCSPGSLSGVRRGVRARAWTRFKKMYLDQGVEGWGVGMEFRSPSIQYVAWQSSTPLG